MNQMDATNIDDFCATKLALPRSLGRSRRRIRGRNHSGGEPQVLQLICLSSPGSTGKSEHHLSVESSGQKSCGVVQSRLMVRMEASQLRRQEVGPAPLAKQRTAGSAPTASNTSIEEIARIISVVEYSHTLILPGPSAPSARLMARASDGVFQGDDNDKYMLDPGKIANEIAVWIRRTAGSHHQGYLGRKSRRISTAY